MAQGRSTTMLLFLLLCFLSPTPALAFGAGTIKSSSALSNHNARHGDLANLLFLIPLAPGKFFDTVDVKRVYFGNWLRDFSQLFDVAGMTTIPEEILLFVVQVIAFMHFGYCTDEFEVTREKIGVYRPEEHMDNPKGYPNNAQAVDSRLRGPVLEAELEYVNEPTGMKNYFNHSFQYIEMQIQASIDLGRRGDSDSKHEAMRCLGNALHTLEDFPAHTNYVELCLFQLSNMNDGLERVFVYVGERASPARAVNGPPIVSGTFGPLDLLDTLLGEVNDMVSTGSISEFSLRTNAESEDNEKAIKSHMKTIGSALTLAGSLGLEVPDTLMGVFKDISSTSPKFERADWGAANQIPTKVWKGIRPFFVFRDKIAMWIEKIDWKKVLGPLYPIAKLLGQLSSAVDQLLYMILGFVLRPIVTRFRETLIGVRNELFNAQEQMGGFNDLTTDPSHSLEAKDHYDNVLNAPASAVAAKMSKIATIMVTAAWTDPSIPAANVISNILSMIHHPFAAGRTTQRMMFGEVQQWWEARSPAQQQQIVSLITPEAVLSGRNYHHPHNLTTQPTAASTTTDPSLGLHKEPDYVSPTPVGGAINRVIENLWHAFDQKMLGSLQKPVIEEVVELFKATPSASRTNPFDAALALLPINPDIAFSGLSAQEIMGLPGMGNIAKTGVLGAMRDNTTLGPVRCIRGLRAGEKVHEEEFRDVFEIVRMLGPEAENVAREWEGMIKMVCRI